MKNSKHVQTKLNLSKQTVRRLSSDELQRAAGGQDDPKLMSPTQGCIPTYTCTAGC